MGWIAPDPPAWVERLNAHAQMVGGGEHLVSLDGDELISTARAMTRLDDFGDADGWREHYDLFVKALAEESDLTLTGRLLTRHDILIALKNRLKLEDHWKRNPQVLSDAIERPVFIVGSARTGTTLLHELFAADPANRTPATWELYHPVEALSGEAMRVPTDLAVRVLHSIQPEYGAMHSSGGDLANECVFIALHTFLGDYWSGSHTVPSYDMHIRTASHHEAYRYHRKFLQTLQQRLPQRRWVLKSPTHLHRLDALFAVYPDARIIQTHRDPLRTIPSLVSLTGTLKSMRCRTFDMSGFVAMLAQGTAMGYDAHIAARESGALPEEAFIDLLYSDLVSDPVAALRGLYDRLGWDFTEQARKGFAARLAEPAREGQVAHRYSLESLGLDPAELRPLFRRYQQHFAVPDETPV